MLWVCLPWCWLLANAAGFAKLCPAVAPRAERLLGVTDPSHVQPWRSRPKGGFLTGATRWPQQEQEEILSQEWHKLQPGVFRGGAWEGVCHPAACTCAHASGSCAGGHLIPLVCSCFAPRLGWMVGLGHPSACGGVQGAARVGVSRGKGCWGHWCLVAVPRGGGEGLSPAREQALLASSWHPGEPRPPGMASHGWGASGASAWPRTRVAL